MSKTHLTEQKFSDFALHPAVIEALEKKGFHNCTPIQALALPLTLEGRDVAGQAQTGTGKTMAFLTSTFHYLLSHPAIADRQVNQPRALIMAPTRELAVQIHADAEPLAQATGLKLGLAYGGDGYDKQLKVLESGVDILIGTTGRLIDYAKQNHINLGAIQVVVLDEADRMYDLGFIKDIRWLFRRMPPATQRLNMLFSATLSYRVRELAFEQMNNAEYVEVEPEQKTGHRIKEELFYPSNEEKNAPAADAAGRRVARSRHRFRQYQAPLRRYLGPSRRRRPSRRSADRRRGAEKNVCVFSKNLPAATSISWSRPMLPLVVCTFRP